MIDEMREYVKSGVREIDSDLVFDGMVFSNEKIATNNIDHSYKLVIGESLISREDSVNLVVTSVEVSIFRVSGSNRVEDFDRTYCKALAIAAILMDIERLDQQGFVKSVVTGSVSPEAIENDDNSVRMRIPLSISCYVSFKGEQNG
jgi:hypothetical protein